MKEWLHDIGSLLKLTLLIPLYFIGKIIDYFKNMNMKKILIALLLIISFSCNNKKEPTVEPVKEEIQTITDSTTSEIQPVGTAVDLQATGMGAKPVTIKVGGTTRVSAVMANNGPFQIPKEEAMVHITVNGKFISVADNIGFRHLDKEVWKLKFKELLNGNYELYFFNRVPITVTTGTAQGFTFTVKGTAKGDADITLTSSLSLESTVGDINGENGSAQMVLPVK